MDYDDLLALTLGLLRDHPDVCRQVAGRARHVLVDEYQDVNLLQADLVEQVPERLGQRADGRRRRPVDLPLPRRRRGPHPGRAQALQRRARPQAGAQLPLDPAHPGPGQPRARPSRREVRQAAVHRPEGGDLPALVAAPDDDMEARFVAQVVLDKREAGTPLNRMAVLFRSGWCSYALEAELDRRKIPFVKYGGLKLAEAAHVKDVVAHLRVAENPADAVAWNRALRLVEGVGPTTAGAAARLDLAGGSRRDRRGRPRAPPVGRRGRPVAGRGPGGRPSGRGAGPAPRRRARARGPGRAPADLLPAGPGARLRRRLPQPRGRPRRRRRARRPPPLADGAPGVAGPRPARLVAGAGRRGAQGRAAARAVDRSTRPRGSSSTRCF